jgi:hypothetical protein
MAGVARMQKQTTAVSNDRDRMWKAMRILREFNQPTLVATAEVGADNVRRYLRGLVAVGYVVITTPANPARQLPAHYRLRRNTGPVAPRLGNLGVYDANVADPYQLPPNKSLCRHAHAMHKALRELVDAIDTGDGVDKKAAAGLEILNRIAEGQ